MGSAAAKRNKDKLEKYANNCNNEGIKFYPLVVETLGGWHSDALEVIAKLARQLSSHTGGENEEVTRHLFQRLGVLLARGNAALILNRMPCHPDAIIDGDLDL